MTIKPFCDSIVPLVELDNYGCNSMRYPAVYTASVVDGGTSVLGYDYEDRVTSITGLRAPNTYAYNALDARVSKTDSSGTSTYFRDGEDVDDDVLSDGAATYTPGIARHTSAGTRVYNPDFIGSNRVESDASGNAVATRVYDAYGNQTASTGTPSSPFGFAGAFGYQEDGDSGLKLLGHRLYDPTAGRFITRDPAQDGSNWYAYCENSPLKYYDDEGMQAMPVPVPTGAPSLPPGWAIVEGGGGAAAEAGASASPIGPCIW